jgi:hypothetical protein
MPTEAQIRLQELVLLSSFPQDCIPDRALLYQAAKRKAWIQWRREVRFPTAQENA